MKRRNIAQQRTVYRAVSVQSIEHFAEPPIVDPSVQPTVQSKVHSNGAYYGVGKLAILTIGVCVFFRHKKGSSSIQGATTKSTSKKNNNVLCSDEKHIINEQF